MAQFLDDDTVAWLRDYRFSGDIDGYREGELYFPGSPSSPSAAPSPRRSSRNPDPPRSSTMIRRSPLAAARIVSAAAKRPIIEMGGRRTP